MPPNTNIQTVRTPGRIKAYFGIFIPSALGMVLYVSTMLFIVVLHQFQSIQAGLQLPSVQLTATVMLWLEKFLNATIGESSTQTLVVGLFWAVVGLGVYIFLRGVARFLVEMGESYDERSYLWPRGVDRNRPLVEAAERNVSRVMAFIGLLIVVFGPLAAVLSGPIWVNFIGPSTLVQILFWVPAGVLTLHACVVLIRLMALRQRLFD